MKKHSVHRVCTICDFRGPLEVIESIPPDKIGPLYFAGSEGLGTVLMKGVPWGATQ